MLSVVSPLYRSKTEIAEFLDRMRSALERHGVAWEIVLVDDHCPEDTGRAASSHAASDRNIRVLRLSRNTGQLAAVLIGLGHARGETLVVIDADLQDRPEDVVVLVATLDAGVADVVAAGRSGRYTSGGRRLTAKMFREVRAALTLGRVPRDAGLFLAARRGAVDAVLALDDPTIHLVSGLARVGAAFDSVSIERMPGGDGGSSYSWRQRANVAAAALIAVTPLYPVVHRFRRPRWSAPKSEWLTGAHGALRQRR